MLRYSSHRLPFRGYTTTVNLTRCSSSVLKLIRVFEDTRNQQWLSCYVVEKWSMHSISALNFHRHCANQHRLPGPLPLRRSKTKPSADTSNCWTSRSLRQLQSRQLDKPPKNENQINTKKSSKGSELKLEPGKPSLKGNHVYSIVPTTRLTSHRRGRNSTWNRENLVQRVTTYFPLFRQPVWQVIEGVENQPGTGIT